MNKIQLETDLLHNLLKTEINSLVPVAQNTQD